MSKTHAVAPHATTVAGHIIGAQAVCASCEYRGEHRANHLIARADCDAHRRTVWQGQA